MFGRVIYDKENVYLDGDKIIGITDFDAKVGFVHKPLTVMGTGLIGQVIDGEITRGFSFSRLVNNMETGILLKMENEMPASFKYESSNEITKAEEWVSDVSKLVSYELNCSVGDIPTSKFSFDCYGRIKNEVSTKNTDFNGFDDFYVARPSDLTFSGINSFYTNRLQSLNYSFSIPYKKRNFIGSYFDPVPVLFSPIEVSLKLEFELDDASAAISTDSICENNFSGVFSFNKCGTEIRKFKIENAKLTDYSIAGAVGPAATFSCTYKTYVNNIEDLKKLVVL